MDLEILETDLPTDAFEWKQYLQEGDQQACLSTIELGRRLHQFYESCDTKPEGTYFSSKVKEWIGMSQPVASKLMAIATDDRLQDYSSQNKLPSGYNALYILSGLSDGELAAGVAFGDINPKTTVKQAQSIAKPVVVSMETHRKPKRETEDLAKAEPVLDKESTEAGFKGMGTMAYFETSTKLNKAFRDGAELKKAFAEDRKKVVEQHSRAEWCQMYLVSEERAHLEIAKLKAEIELLKIEVA